ncbi:MAG TPA: hypothetical protein VGS19_28805 [Streptosporangiaceae bacterium]|nr:hypothetical protein [Streptosporangiaceae bacterium]
MTSGWAKLTAQHVDEIVAGCTVLADALDAAGGYIVAQKAEAVAELVGLAAAFVADQAAAVVTFGLSEAALPLLEELAAKLVESLEMDLQQYIAGQVIEAAAKPLAAKVDAALSGLDWSQSGAVAGTSGAFWLTQPRWLPRRRRCGATRRSCVRRRWAWLKPCGG